MPSTVKRQFDELGHALGKLETNHLIAACYYFSHDYEKSLSYVKNSLNMQKKYKLYAFALVSIEIRLLAMEKLNQNIDSAEINEIERIINDVKKTRSLGYDENIAAYLILGNKKYLKNAHNFVINIKFENDNPIIIKTFHNSLFAKITLEEWEKLR